MEQGSLSTYGSIIPQTETQWTKLDDTNALARLHRKFWPRGETQNELMNVDEDEYTEEDEDEDEEIGPGCYVLDLGVPELGRSMLWIRKEYIRLYKYCNEYLESRRGAQLPPSVVITGQPGIGKSYWILYALYRRLAEGKPIMWYRDSTVFLFVNEGVYQAPPWGALSTTFRTRVWTLVDSDSDTLGVPSRLAVPDTKHLIIFCSSPQSGRWKGLGKTTLSRIAIMNPWTREEISQAAVIHGLTANDPKIDDMYNRFGPTPRICFNFSGNNALFVLYKDRYEDALNELSLETLDRIISQRRKLSIDTEFHTLFLMRRVSKKDLIRANEDVSDGNNFSHGYLEPITHVVKMELRNQFRKESRAAQIQLYRRLVNVEGTRRIAGLVFESLAQSMLEKKITLMLVPIVKRESGGSGQGKKLPRWHSNHGDGAEPSSVRLIDISPAGTFVYPGSSLDQIEDMVYHVPEAQNQVAFDSFILAGQKLYIFQFSIASDHPIKKGIIHFFRQGSLPRRADWHFVFVVPPGLRSEISCPQPRDSDLKGLLDEMNIFYAVLDFGAE